MSLFRFRLNKCTKLFASKCYTTALQNDEYTPTPQYPPILDLSFEKKLERKKEAVHETIQNVKTVEEKQIKLNMPRFYGFKSYMLTEDCIPYNSLTLSQHVTRTHLIVNGLPDYYKELNVDEVVKDLKSEIEEAVLVELEGYKRKCDIKNEQITKGEMDDIIGSSLCRQINRIIISKLSSGREDMENFQFDYNPRIESTWCVGGMNPPKNIQRMRQGAKWMEPFADNPTDRVMVYTGSPILTLRSDSPLPFIVSPAEAENPALEVPFFKYDPRVLGCDTSHRHMSNVPGFWPGDPNQFGLLSYHKRGHLHLRAKYQDAQDDKEALHRQAILASFGWLSAQANFLGFTTYNDITYPLVTQTVITNGQTWSFYAYQMNTMLVHSKYIYENPKRNICWGTEEMQLFENQVDGKLVGFNEEVLKLLMKFYANVPESRLGINLRPYLGSEGKIIADYEDDDKRQWLEREYKFLVSNRPRWHEFPEIHAWEKIYKIDHKTRHMDKRMTPFDHGKKPQDRTLDDRMPFYVPRKNRPDLPKHKGRNEKEYFP